MSLTQDVVLAGRSDDCGICIYGRDGLQQLLTEAVEAYAVEGGEVVGLVYAPDEGLSGLDVDVGPRHSGLCEHEDDAGFFGGLETALLAETFNGVGGVAQAGGVEKAESDAGDDDGVFHYIARGALQGADDGTLFADKAVEQGALAHVGGADDGNGNALADSLSCGVAFYEVVDMIAQLLRELQEVRAGSELDVFVVGEVQFEFEKGGELQKLSVECCELGGYAAAELG